MQSIRAFVNRDALYVLIEGAVGRGTSEIELDFMIDGRRVRYGWEPNPNWNEPWRADITTEWVDLGAARMSEFALGEAFEGRIDLRDLPDAELHLLDTGHFALEEDGTRIAALMSEFLLANAAQ